MSEEKSLPLWEVFVQAADGTPHEHAGSLHAADSETALQNARDVYARRGSVSNIWVVRSDQIVASSLNDNAQMFDAMKDKPYRHPQFYKVPKDIRD